MRFRSIQSEPRKSGLAALFGAGLALMALAIAAAVALPAAAEVAAQPVTWQDLRNAYPGNTYSAAPAVAAIPQSQRAFLAWEEKDQISQGDELLVSRNNGLGQQFDDVQDLDRAGYQLLGNISLAHDNLGRIHVAWFMVDGNGVSIKYARTNPTGSGWERNGSIQVTRSSNSNPRKNVALAIGPDNRVHIIWGREEQDILYTFSDDGIDWAAPVGLPWDANPRDLTLAVSTGNVVMAAWIDRGPNVNGDVLATTRNANGSWNPPSNISQPVGRGRSHTYWPRLAADHTGGIRAVWSDENVALAGEERGTTDIYYREWAPAGWSSNIFQVVNNPGESQQPEITVDRTGGAHVVWMDDTGRNFHNYSLLYSVGGGGSQFIGARRPLPANWEGAQNKDPALDWANDVLHLGFSSTIDDPQRDNYYSWGRTQGSPTTNTPVATPTLAPCTFYDVAETDYYYAPVRYLCPRGAISGYSDGTFRPGLSATRGQIAKIVVAAEGWAINTDGGPHFRDVDPGNPFYGFIETAYNRGIISGYSCGGNCLEFRWGNSITRGQLAKVIVVAEGWPLINPPTSTFRDVATNNPFFREIETAYNRQIISGYSCGGNCLEFRWNLSATRAQIAKIVHSAIIAP